jgi:TonB-dependent receptor
LQPTRSKNLDLSFEWYYHKGSMISIAGFWKHLDNFTQSVSSSGTAANNPFGLGIGDFVQACGGTGSDWTTVSLTACPNGANTSWAYSVTQNTKGAPLYGTEINWQQQLDFLPHPLDNMGVLGNVTYVQGQQTFYNTSGAVTMLADLQGLSRITYNATVYYDDTVFQARLTGAFRSHYLIDSSTLTVYNNQGIFGTATFNLDASASYKLDENIMITLDALNLTNQATDIRADKTALRAYEYHVTGREFFAGFKFTY